MTSNYKFFQTVSGISYFARVWVEVDLGAGIVKIIDAIDGNTNPDKGEYNANTAPSWVKAAVAGAGEAVDYLTDTGFIQNGCIVRIVRLVGSIVDSSEDVISCATALATWQAACPQLPLPETFFERGAWKLRYPKIEREANTLLSVEHEEL